MNELARLHALDTYEKLAAFPQKELDEITELASLICETPISIITFVDAERQIFKSKVGLDITETPREHSFCQYTIESPGQVMVVPDSHLDDRFKENPLATGDLNVRFYAGAPLVTEDGFALGSLCVIDHEPRLLSPSQERSLTLLSNRVVKLLDASQEHQKSVRLFKLSNERLFTLTEKAPFIIATLNSSLIITYINRTFTELNPENMLGQPAWPWIHQDYREPFKNLCQTVLEGEQQSTIDLKLFRKNENIEWISCIIAPIQEENGPNLDLMIICVDITERKRAEELKKQQITSLKKMLHMVSHELRSPITKIQGLVTLLNKNDQFRTDSEKDKCLKYLIDSANELDQYTKELTNFLYEDFSKYERPKE